MLDGTTKLLGDEVEVIDKHLVSGGALQEPFDGLSSLICAVARYFYWVGGMTGAH